MENNNVISKLRKLIAHEESARSIGSIAEAESFAAKIQQLLIEHKLEVSQVTAGDDHDDERDEQVEEQRFDPMALGIPYNGRQRVAWIETLASVVATAYFCRILVVPRSVVVYFVGKSTDRTIAGNVFAALVRGAIAACDTEYAKAKRDPWAETSGFRAHPRSYRARETRIERTARSAPPPTPPLLLRSFSRTLTAP